MKMVLMMMMTMMMTTTSKNLVRNPYVYNYQQPFMMITMMMTSENLVRKALYFYNNL